jgi:hypothetical protein
MQEKAFSYWNCDLESPVPKRAARKSQARWLAAIIEIQSIQPVTIAATVLLQSTTMTLMPLTTFMAPLTATFPPFVTTFTTTLTTQTTMSLKHL